MKSKDTSLLKARLCSVMQNRLSINDCLRSIGWWAILMEELEKVLQALNVIERYDEYLLRKNWGRLLIVIGSVLPLSALVNMNTGYLAAQTGSNPRLISSLGFILMMVLSLGFIAYIFFDSWHIARRTPQRESSDSRRRPVALIKWFVAIVLTILLVSVPLLLISDALLFGYAFVIALSVGLILAGIVLNKMASGILRHSA